MFTEIITFVFFLFLLFKAQPIPPQVPENLTADAIKPCQANFAAIKPCQTNFAAIKPDEPTGEGAKPVLIKSISYPFLCERVPSCELEPGQDLDSFLDNLWTDFLNAPETKIGGSEDEECL